MQGVSAEQQEAQKQLQEMWQRSLASVHSKLRGDKVENVLTVRPRRVLVLTNRHVVYCCAKFLDRTHTVRLRWFLDYQNVNNILGAPRRVAYAAGERPCHAWGSRLSCTMLLLRAMGCWATRGCLFFQDGWHAGDESRFTVLVRAARIMHIPCAGTWRLPVTKRVRTQSLEAFESVAGVLNDQVTDPSHSRLRHIRSVRASTHATQNLPLLRITEAVEEAEETVDDAGGDEQHSEMDHSDPRL